MRFIGARPQTPIFFPGASEETPPGLAGRAAIERYAPLFGLTRPDEEVRLIRDVIKPRRGSRHRYRQIFQGVPVLAGELLVNLNESRRLVSMTGEISPNLSLSTRPGLNPARARDIALEAVAKWYELTTQELKATNPTLWIVDPRLIVPSDRPATLTWRMMVTNKGKLRDRAYQRA